MLPRMGCWTTLAVRFRALAAAEGAEVVSVCAAIESEIAKLEAEEKEEFLADLGLQEPGWID